MHIIIERYPTEQDWSRCYRLALGTEGKTRNVVPTMRWRERMLQAEHSPIRTLMFTITLEDVPYYVAMHLVRHKFGVEHYVSSQRDDRNGNPAGTRGKQPQDTPVTYTMDVNAQELITMAHRRICAKADAETRRVMIHVRDAVVDVCPEFDNVLVPMCEYRNGCYEMQSCGRWQP